MDEPMDESNSSFDEEITSGEDMSEDEKTQTKKQGKEEVYSEILKQRKHEDSAYEARRKKIFMEFSHIFKNNPQLKSKISKTEKWQEELSNLSTEEMEDRLMYLKIDSGIDPLPHATTLLNLLAYLESRIWKESVIRELGKDYEFLSAVDNLTPDFVKNVGTSLGATGTIISKIACVLGERQKKLLEQADNSLNHNKDASEPSKKREREEEQEPNETTTKADKLSDQP